MVLLLQKKAAKKDSKRTKGTNNMTDQIQLADKPEKSKTAEKLSTEVFEGPPKSTQQIANDWDQAFSKLQDTGNAESFGAVSHDLAHAAQKAYQSGGTLTLKQLEIDLNKKIAAPGAGPIFVTDDKTIEIHNIQTINTKNYDALTPEQQEKYHEVTSSRGYMSRVRELTPPAAIEKPENPGLKLKPGETYSQEYPSDYVVAAAFKAGAMLDKDWMAGNSEQKYLVDNLQTAASELDKIPSTVEIEGKASQGEVRPVNDFLKSKGFSMELSPIGPSDVAFAGTMSLQGAWGGEAGTLTIDGKVYPSALVHNTKTFQVGDFQVSQLYKKDGVTVYAAMVPDKLASYQVTAKATELTPAASAQATFYDAVKLPMVYKNTETNLDGLLGLQTLDGTTRISQAKMQMQLSVDENGFKVKQAAAFGTTRGGPEIFVIDKPFIMWATADGCTKPLFATKVDQQYWMDPKKK
ncbi:MAG: hypothetical protein K2W82_07560 [Candidatus Obscuribacterales bacterium]|nr:hypothetical protein [Candidatus Obscuribacterales bacterium]